MTSEKSIIIGCDHAAALAAVMDALKRTVLFSHHVITAARISDLLGIVRGLDPDLVILCFRNNQFVLNDFDSFVRKPHIPLLCIGEVENCEQLQWNPQHIVFTYALDQVENHEHLCSRIMSIFTLRGHNYAGRQGETKDRNMSRYVLELDQKVDALQKIRERITQLFPRVEDPVRAELISIVNAIKSSAGNANLWEDFKVYYEKTDPGFLKLLSKKHPELTTRDLKYCCYLKMNMGNEDIKSLLGINQESVRTHKYRLKKKMSLPKDQDLVAYLNSMGQSRQVALA